MRATKRRISTPPYIGIWKRLDPTERDRRLAETIRRAANGEKLATIGSKWNVGASTLCMALISYCPTEWRTALVAQAIAQSEDIDLDDPKLTRAHVKKKIKMLEWRMKHALLSVPFGPLHLQGRQLLGPCFACKERRSVFVRATKPTQCYLCGWSGKRLDYLKAIERRLAAAAVHDAWSSLDTA